MGTYREDPFEYERLLAEKAQEMQMKEMLEQSVGELETTIADLEKRIESMDEESNEWKTRYESQCEINQQFERQILRLSDKVDEYKRNLQDIRLPKSVRTYEEPQEVTAYHLKQMERDKGALITQLKDMEWKLDQASKAYHKANEERKNVQTELTVAKGQMESLKSHQKAVMQHDKDNFDGTPRMHGYTNKKYKSPYPSTTSPRSKPSGSRNTNIAEDHRIIDPRHGPIKKTAAVKTLPRLQDGRYY